MSESAAASPDSVVVALAGGVAASSAQQLPSEPPRGFGASITGAFEGWFDNPDGSRTFLVGYLNRNAEQALDVPIGPNNRIEPGGPDLGQPTHFLPGRRHGMFTVTVPKEFTPEQRLTWTIVANGQTDEHSAPAAPRLQRQPVRRRRGQEHAAGRSGSRRTASRSRDRSRCSRQPSPRTASMSSPLVAHRLGAATMRSISSGTNAPPRNPPPPVRLTGRSIAVPAR